MFHLISGKNSSVTISPDKAKERIETGKVMLLDVRTPEEYRESHIPGSISIPLNQIPSAINKVVKDKDTEIIVYCLSGMRASSACRQLLKMGYSNVKNMGGIQSWPYKTESGRLNQI